MGTPKFTSQELRDWAAALKSGKYNQGQGVLHRVNDGKPDTYCCLGVLCEINNLEKIQVDPGNVAYVFPATETAEKRIENVFLINAFSDKFGRNGKAVVCVGDTLKVHWPPSVPVCVPVCASNYISNNDGSLSLWNDSGVSFEEIGDYLIRVANAMDTFANKG